MTTYPPFVNPSHCKILINSQKHKKYNFNIIFTMSSRLRNLNNFEKRFKLVKPIDACLLNCK